MRTGPLIDARRQARRRLQAGVVASLGLTIAVILSSVQTESAIGAPSLWPWLLTGLQVLSLWAAGRRLWWAWLLGGTVQLPWIAYALMTEQIGFIPGCLVSASVQTYSFLTDSRPARRSEVMT